MAKLIYIISTGHSGSTLLDLLIGSLDKVFSTGEFTYFTWALYLTRNGEGSVKDENVCSCGLRFQDCKVWSEVISRIENENKINIIDNPLLFNTSVLSSFKYRGKTSLKHRILNKIISYEMFFLKNYFLSNLFEKEYIKEANNVWKLIDTIGDVTNSDYIVDSSKNFLRYYLLKKQRPNDVFLVINSRDNMGFAYSFLKRNIQPKDSLLQKRKYNKKVARLTRNISDYYSTTYDVVSQNPEKVLEDLAIKLNLEYKPGQSNNIDTMNYHLIAGNPMRYKGKIKIKHDNDWEKKLTLEKRNEINYYINKYRP